MVKMADFALWRTLHLSTHPHAPSGCRVEDGTQKKGGFWAQAGAGPGQGRVDGRGEPQ